MASSPEDSPSPAGEPAADAAPGRGPRRKLGTLTIHDVAALAGVSSVTASRYFNDPGRVSEKRREKLAAVIRQTGYVPSQVARRLASSQGGLVGAVMQNVSSPTFAPLVRAMGDTLEQHGLQLLLANSDYSIASEERAIQAFLGWHPSGLILTRGDHSEASDALLAQMRIPVVEAWEVVEGRPFHQVGFSQREVGRILTRHFLEQGVRRLRFAMNARLDDTRAARRIEGYTEAMQAAGLAADVVYSAHGDDIEAGTDHAVRLSQEAPATRPRALVFANDSMAMAALLGCARLGLAVPHDCALAGFGDAAIGAILTPALTTVRTQPQAIGSTAARTLVELLHAPAGEPVGIRTHHIDCELVVRESSRISR
ncbi:substrate-binding domain-containing protein [Xylophilus rhododendri]|uniref:Substrate-binding domain-containing protein n=1 Tax=Xylophilus rhododendri TaxID=2697032 RepID=A0A857JBT5_9BURK|nr:LacI family DNA-binding transcriptional regulator [Xylophilus rhododendri]QHJ01138.1 substrate-binding domain-containing protein [Xylophilus rhododendri]